MRILTYNKYKFYIGQKIGKLLILDLVSLNGRPVFQCKCECGNISTPKACQIIRGLIKSCSEKCTLIGRPATWLRKKEGEAAFNALYNNYRAGAIKRNYQFKLTKEEAKLLFQNKCFYCNCDPISTHRHPNWFGDFKYNGIDRLDNSIGYIKENCVTACKNCNLLKNNQNKQEFLNWIIKVYKHLNLQELKPK